MTSQFQDLFYYVGTVPSPRSFHTSVISGTDVYLFGGGIGEKECLNDLHRLDMLEMKFSLVHPPSEVEDDHQPKGRCYHTMTLISPKAAIVFGGEDDREAVLGDCWLLDLVAAKQGMEVTSLWKRYLRPCCDSFSQLCSYVAEIRKIYKHA